MSPEAARPRGRLRLRRLATFAAMGTLLLLLDRAMPAGEGTASPVLRVQVPAQASAAQIERAIEEAVLVDAALRLGLPWSDPFVRARLLADLRAADPAAEAADDELLLQRARALDLVRAHPVVRARVAEAMRRRLEHAAGIEAPTEAELDAYVRAHAERYSRPPRLDFRHVQLSAVRRGDMLEPSAIELAARLRDAGLDAADGLGDPSLLSRDHIGTTPAAVDAAFGSGVGETIAAAEPGRWVGPVRGAYGMHLVYVSRRRPGGLPPLVEIADRVRADLIADRRRAALQARLHALRGRVRVEVQRGEGAS